MPTSKLSSIKYKLKDYKLKKTISTVLTISFFASAVCAANIKTEEIKAPVLMNTIVEKSIPLSQAEKGLEQNSKLISKTDYIDILKAKRYTDLEHAMQAMTNSVDANTKQLDQLSLEKKNKISSIEEGMNAELMKVKAEYTAKVKKIRDSKIQEIGVVTGKFNNDEKLLKQKHLEEKTHYAKKIEDLNKELANLDVAKQMKNEIKVKSNLTVEISSSKALFEYIERTKSLDNVILTMNLTETLGIYIKALKEAVPFGVEDRIVKYLLQVAKSDKDIDEDMLFVQIKSKNIRELTQTYNAIVQYKKKGN